MAADADTDNRFDVLVSLDGVNWTRYAGIQARNGESAIERVRETFPELPNEAQFYASKRFVPRRLTKQMIESWDLMPVEEIPDEALLERAEEDRNG